MDAFLKPVTRAPRECLVRRRDTRCRPAARANS
jgi:hypothetical protein